MAYKTKQVRVGPYVNKIHCYICTRSNEEYTDVEEGGRKGIDFISCLWELPSAFLEARLHGSVICRRRDYRNPKSAGSEGVCPALQVYVIIL